MEKKRGPVGDDNKRWVLDPIDGTVNFVHGLPLYAISLALTSGQQPVLGIIDLPALNTRFHAALGLGALCGQKQLTAPPPPADLAAAIVAIGDYAVGERAETKNRIRLGVTTRLAAKVLRVRMLGAAAIDLAWLAQGVIDASVTLSNSPWGKRRTGAVPLSDPGQVVPQEPEGVGGVAADLFARHELG